MAQFIMKVYVGNTPPNHCLMMMGHRLNTFFWPRQSDRPGSMVIKIAVEFVTFVYIVNAVGSMPLAYEDSVKVKMV
jgi:hypothetical protein